VRARARGAAAAAWRRWRGAVAFGFFCGGAVEASGVEWGVRRARAGAFKRKKRAGRRLGGGCGGEEGNLVGR
jgi:hypothetical protein